MSMTASLSVIDLLQLLGVDAVQHVADLVSVGSCWTPNMVLALLMPRPCCIKRWKAKNDGL